MSVVEDYSNRRPQSECPKTDYRQTCEGVMWSEAFKGESSLTIHFALPYGPWDEYL